MIQDTIREILIHCATLDDKIHLPFNIHQIHFTAFPLSLLGKLLVVAIVVVVVHFIAIGIAMDFLLSNINDKQRLLRSLHPLMKWWLHHMKQVLIWVCLQSSISYFEFVDRQGVK